MQMNQKKNMKVFTYSLKPTKEKVKSVTPGLNNEKDKDGLSLDKIETVDSEEEVIFDAEQYSLTGNWSPDFNIPSTKKNIIKNKRKSLQIYLNDKGNQAVCTNLNFDRQLDMNSAHNNLSTTNEGFCRKLSCEYEDETYCEQNKVNKLKSPNQTKMSTKIGSIIKSGFSSYLAKLKMKSPQKLLKNKKFEETPSNSAQNSSKIKIKNTSNSIFLDLSKYHSPSSLPSTSTSQFLQNIQESDGNSSICLSLRPLDYSSSYKFK